MFCEQIEKFQCLKSSTAQGQSLKVIRIYVAPVICPQMFLQVSEVFNQYRFGQSFAIQVAVSFP